MRLAIVLPSLAGGGMERVGLRLINEWVQRGTEVDLVVTAFTGPLCDQIPKNVQIFEIGRRHAFLFPFGLWRYIKARRPSHILAAGNDVNALTLAIAGWCGKGISTVASVHNHLSSEIRLAKGGSRIKERLVVWLLRRTLRYSHGIVAVSRGVAEDWHKHFPSCTNKLHVIYNPVITPEFLENSQLPLLGCPVPFATPWILYVGRFVYAKGLDVLIDSFALLTRNSAAHLVLMGDGEFENEIERRISSYGLGDRVHLVGFKNNPAPWMRAADVLVLPSRHEGLGNVLIEALACGTQVVATDCPSGPSEILDGGTFGQLVPVESPVALAAALLSSLEGRFHVSAEALKQRAMEFTAERAALLYEQVLTAPPAGG